MSDGIETQNFASLLFVRNSSTPLRMTGRMRSFGDVEDSLKKGGKGEDNELRIITFRRICHPPVIEYKDFQSAISLNNQLIGL